MEQQLNLKYLGLVELDQDEMQAADGEFVLTSFLLLTAVTTASGAIIGGTSAGLTGGNVGAGIASGAAGGFVGGAIGYFCPAAGFGRYANTAASWLGGGGTSIGTYLWWS